MTSVKSEGDAPLPGGFQNAYVASTTNPVKRIPVVVDPYVSGGGFQLDVSNLNNDVIRRTVDSVGDLRDDSKRLEVLRRLAEQQTREPGMSDDATSSKPADVETGGEAPRRPGRPRKTRPGNDSELLTKIIDELDRRLSERINRLARQADDLEEDPALVEARQPVPPRPATSAGIGIDAIDRGPGKPLVRVGFEMPGMGYMPARYHAVVEGDGCLILVYDTRYEDGDPFIPPWSDNAPVSLRLHLSDRQAGTSRILDAVSCGLRFDIGCLSCVMLLLPKTHAVSAPATPVDTSMLSPGFPFPEENEKM